MSITTCVVAEAAMLIVPVGLRPTVNEFEVSIPVVKLMFAVPGQPPLGQIVAKPPAAS